MDGNAALENMAAHIRALGKLDELAAREAAPLLEQAAKASASAGVDPSTGAAWANKIDGSRAAPNAARDVSVHVAGNALEVRVVGNHVHVHLGRGKTQAPRPIIPPPGAAIPASYAAAIRDGVARAVAKAGA